MACDNISITLFAGRSYLINGKRIDSHFDETAISRAQIKLICKTLASLLDSSFFGTVIPTLIGFSKLAAHAYSSLASYFPDAAAAFDSAIKTIASVSGEKKRALSMTVEDIISIAPSGFILFEYFEYVFVE